MSTTPRLSAISRLSNCLSKLHGERCRRDPRADKLEAFQNELERAALAVIGLDHSGLLPTCGACHGSGRRDLTPTESMTLASVPAEWVTTTAIRDALRVPGPVAANRLAAMEAIGLVESKRDALYPRTKLWRRK